MSYQDCDVTPLRNWILLEIEPRKTHFASLKLPDWTSEENVAERCAKVMSVGHGAFSKKGHRKPPQVEVGDRVLIRGFLREVSPVDNDRHWMDDEREYCFVAEDDILAVVDDGTQFGPYSEVKQTP